MPRPSLADASASQPKLPGTERSPATNTPFVVRCRDVRIGSPGAKHVYLTLATWCEVYADADHATCWPSLETVRIATEFKRRAFKDHYQTLLQKGFVSSQRGQPGLPNKKTIWTPEAAMRRRSVGSESDPTRRVGIRPPKYQRRSERTPSNVAGGTEDRKQQQQQAHHHHRPDPTDRQLGFAADLGIDPTGKDGVTLGKEIEIANAARNAARASSRPAVATERREWEKRMTRAYGPSRSRWPDPPEHLHHEAEADMDTDELHRKLSAWTERTIAREPRSPEREQLLDSIDAAQAGELPIYAIIDGFPRPVSELPEQGVQVGVDAGGHVEWVSIPREAAA